MWNWRTGAFVLPLGHYTDGVAIAPEGSQVAFSGLGSSSTVTVRDLQPPGKILSLELEDWVTTLCFSPTGELLTGSADNLIRFWDSSTGQLLRTSEGHCGDVHSLSFSPDGRLLLSAGDGDNEQVPPEAYLWDLQTGALTSSLTEITGRTALDAAFSPDGSKLVTGSMSTLDGRPGTVQLWDTGNGSLLRTIRPVAGNSIWSVAFSPEGTRILSGDLDARLWDTASGQLLRVFDVGEEVYSVAYPPDGTRVLTGGIGSAAVWDIRDLLASPRFSSSGNGSEIHRDLGTLQFAPSVAGPWNDLPAASPFRLSTIGGQGFFRVKVEE